MISSKKVQEQPRFLPKTQGHGVECTVDLLESGQLAQSLSQNALRLASGRRRKENALTRSIFNTP